MNLMDDPESGITNNTSAPICVPAATKEVEDENGDKTELLNTDSGSLALTPSTTDMMA